MGYMRHHAVLVSGSYDDHLERAHEEAIAIFGFHDLAGLVSPVIAGASNGERSFFVAPDGSKEGWGTSDAGDEARRNFCAYLARQAYDDGSSPLSWVEVVYGDEMRQNRVTRSDDRPFGAVIPAAVGEHPDQEEP